jgi:hypothetical protein
MAKAPRGALRDGGECWLHGSTAAVSPIARHVFASNLRAVSRKSASNQRYQHSKPGGFSNIILFKFANLLIGLQILHPS